MSLQSAIANLRTVFLSKAQRWNTAQSSEEEYWVKTPAYYMPWLDRLNRFGYEVGDSTRYAGYVDSLPLLTVTSRFAFLSLPERPVVVDLGCGPAGIGYAVEHAGITYCIDPLMPIYRRLPGYEQNIFARLGKNKVLVADPGESARIPEAADLVFCINVL